MMYVLYLSVHLIPVNPVREDGLNPKSRKRIMPDLLTEPPAIDPVYEAHVYCNIPTIAERSMEGELWEGRPQVCSLFPCTVIRNDNSVHCQSLAAWRRWSKYQLVWIALHSSKHTAALSFPLVPLCCHDFWKLFCVQTIVSCRSKTERVRRGLDVKYLNCNSCYTSAAFLTVDLEFRKKNPTEVISFGIPSH